MIAARKRKGQRSDFSQTDAEVTSILFTAATNSLDETSLLLGFFLIALSSIKPYQKRLGGLADLFAGGEVDVLFTRLGAPVLEHVFGNEILLVEGVEYLGDLRDKRGVFIADETFGATEESFLVTLGGDHLLGVSSAASRWTEGKDGPS